MVTLSGLYFRGLREGEPGLTCSSRGCLQPPQLGRAPGTGLSGTSHSLPCAPGGAGRGAGRAGQGWAGQGGPAGGEPSVWAPPELQGAFGGARGVGAGAGPVAPATIPEALPSPWPFLHPNLSGHPFPWARAAPWMGMEKWRAGGRTGLGTLYVPGPALRAVLSPG